MQLASFFDITGDGLINNVDVGLTNFQYFDELPDGNPTPPRAEAGFGSPPDSVEEDDTN